MDAARRHRRNLSCLVKCTLAGHSGFSENKPCHMRGIGYVATAPSDSLLLRQCVRELHYYKKLDPISARSQVNVPNMRQYKVHARAESPPNLLPDPFSGPCQSFLFLPRSFHSWRFGMNYAGLHERKSLIAHTGMILPTP